MGLAPGVYVVRVEGPALTGAALLTGAGRDPHHTGDQELSAVTPPRALVGVMPSGSASVAAAAQPQVVAWTPTMAADWLEATVGLPEYRGAFVAQNIDDIVAIDPAQAYEFT